jgi:hypothetical protein
MFKNSGKIDNPANAPSIIPIIPEEIFTILSYRLSKFHRQKVISFLSKDLIMLAELMISSNIKFD